MQERKRRGAPCTTTTPATEPAASTTTTVAPRSPRWVAPSDEEYKRVREERERRRQALREEMEQHRATCEGCERCAPPRAITAAPGDDVRDVRVVRAGWAERFAPLGSLPSIADALSEAMLVDLDRDLAVLLGPRADGAPGEVELTRTASEASHVRSAEEMLRYVSADGMPDALRQVAQRREEHHDDERMRFVDQLAEELEGMDPEVAARHLGAGDLVMERVGRIDDAIPLAVAIQLDGGDVRIVDAGAAPLDSGITLAIGSGRVFDACDDERRIVRRISLADGCVHIIWAQDADHAERARRLVDRDPALLDHLDRLDGVDGIAISTVDTVDVRPIDGLPEIMQRAYAVFPSLEAQFHEAVREDGEPDPMSLWSALALDPPARPTKPEIEALKKRAQVLRDEHDRFVAGADVLNRNAAEDNAYRALQLRCDALIATREWLVALRLAKASLRAIAQENVDHRRTRVKILAERLDGWNRPEIARLIRESTDGKKPLSPELLRNYPEPAKLERATHDTDLDWELAQERYAERLKATETRLVDLVRQDIKRASTRKRGRRNAKH